MFSNISHRTIEWGDCDPAGIVFYPRFSEMLDAATALLFEAASGMPRSALIRHYRVMGCPMVNAVVNYRATATFDDRIVIQSTIRRVGRSSLEIGHMLHRDRTLCVEAVETRVWTVRDNRDGKLRSSEIPAKFRRQLEADNKEGQA